MNSCRHRLHCHWLRSSRSAAAKMPPKEYSRLQFNPFLSEALQRRQLYERRHCKRPRCHMSSPLGLGLRSELPAGVDEAAACHILRAHEQRSSVLSQHDRQHKGFNHYGERSGTRMQKLPPDASQSMCMASRWADRFAAEPS